MSLSVAGTQAIRPLATTEGCEGHLLSLPGGDWMLWRWLAVRGAGFPLRDVLSLASPECAEAADLLLEAGESLERTRICLIARLKEDLKSASGEHRKQLSKAIDRLKKGNLSIQTDLLSDGDAAALRQTSEQANRARELFQAGYHQAANQTSSAVRHFALDSRFREALTWQNRMAYQRGVGFLLRQAPGTNGSKVRENEELIASYAQRYCTKNETIGFFGPVGWGRFSSTAPAIAVHAGPGLVDSREVFFEQWCIDALVDSLASDPAMRPWLIPRSFPNFRLDGHCLLQPIEGPRLLSPAESLLFSYCSGRLSARQIADTLLSLPNPLFVSEQQIFDLLARWQQLNIIKWGFEVDVQLYPERGLRSALQGIGDTHLRLEVLGRLDELEQARDEIASAAGNPQLLDPALQRLEEIFTRITGAAATRLEGRTYAGRTLVYEDCRRDLSLEVGPELLRRIGPPLTLLLQSVRWMTTRVAAAYEEAFEVIYDQLLAATDQPEVDALDFWLQAQRKLITGEGSLMGPVVESLQGKWQEILNLDYDQREQRFSFEQLCWDVERAFPALCAGWKAGRHHSPDLMISASSLDAIRRGDYELVLGELHVGINTLAAGSFVGQHPAPEELFEAIASDLPQARVIPAYPKARAGVNARTQYALVTQKDYYFECSEKTLIADREKALQITELVVSRDECGLFVSTRDGRLRFQILDFFGEKLSGISANHFKIMRPAPHIPRIYFDHLIVSRESWTVPAAGLSFASHKDPASRFLLARLWRRQLGIPRFAFAKIPIEVKPVFVDFDSPILINLLSKSIRRCLELDQPCSITFSEMLPDPHHVWLPDSLGNTYSSEFRIVALDPAS